MQCQQGETFKTEKTPQFSKINFVHIVGFPLSPTHPIDFPVFASF